MNRIRIKSILLNLIFFILVWVVDLFKIYNTLDPAVEYSDMELVSSALQNALFVMGLVWLNHYFFIPYFFDKKKYFLYGCLLFVVIFSIALYFGYHRSAFKVFSVFNYYTFTTGIGMSIFFVVRSLNFQKEIIEKEQLQQQMELNYLKAQVNPHFLFNALNSIYSLSRQTSPHTPETVMQLSELLRYQLESAKKDAVDVQEEISFLQNYLLLEEKRLGRRCTIDFSIEGEYTSLKIAPMLLIPFVENAVKYAAQSTNDNSTINVSIVIKESRLHFYAENSKPPNVVKQKREGTGISNVKRRLNLLYPDCYSLTIEDGRENFVVRLEVELVHKKW
jgi:two-component system, LytTR family, sensor kinase